MDSHTLRSILIRVGLQTLICIAASVAATTAVLMWRAGGDFAAVPPVEPLWTTALMISAASPALLAPLIAWPAARRLHEVERVHDELAKAALVDSLTGVLNRRGFDEAAKAAFADGRRETGCDVAIMCDIDHFKSINDRYGHDFGDLALVHVAGLLDAVLQGRRAVVGRFGGEEFVAVFSSSGFDSASAIGDRIRGAVLALAKPHAESAKSPFVTLSVGVATLNPDWPEDAQSLLRRADAALYRAKRNGRDRTELDLRAVGG